MKLRLFAVLIAVLAMLVTPLICFAEPDTNSDETVPTTAEQTTAAPTTASSTEATTAETTAAPTTVDASAPRFMVSAYALDTGYLTPDGKATLKITLKNMSASKSISNIKLALEDEQGGIKPEGLGTQYAEYVAASGTYEWSVAITASKTVASGEHKLTLSSEYQDEYYNNFTSSDTLTVTVKQRPTLVYEGLKLPVTLRNGGSDTAVVKLVNTGKSVIKNARVDFNVKGVTTGGSAFVGELAVGASTEVKITFTANTEPGSVTGNAVIAYEDEFGESYKETVNVSSIVVEGEESSTEVTENTEKTGDRPWVKWVLSAFALILGGVAGFYIKTAVIAIQQRKK